MELLFILGLVGLGPWLWVQSQRIETLTRRLEELERRIAATEKTREPLLLDQPLREHETEPPLLLDTPVPEASNDVAPPIVEPPVETPAAEALRVDAGAPAATPPHVPARRGYGHVIGAIVLAAALLAPAATNLSAWTSATLTFYVCAVGGLGVMVAAQRRWTWATLIGIFAMQLWFAVAIAAGDTMRALATLSMASLAAAGLAWTKSRTQEAPALLTWRDTRALAPGAAVSIGSVLLIWVWLAITPTPSGSVAAPALAGMLHVALAAWLVRRRSAASAALAVAVAGLVGGFLVYLQARFVFGPLGADFYPAIIAAAAVAAAAAIAARPHRTSRALPAGAGAAGAALLVMMAASSRSDWHAFSAWATLLIGAVFCFAAAWRTARDTRTPERDRAVDVWGAASAVLVLLTVESALPAQARAAGDAAACLVFAAGFAWRGWRALRYAALAAAALTLLQALSPALLEGAMPPWGALVILALTTALLLDAAYFAGVAEPRSVAAELLSSAAIATILIACFLSLRLVTGGELSGFAEAAWRALMLMIAGFALTQRRTQMAGVVVEWRPHALIAAGLLYALIGPGLVFNPWWGGAARLAGEAASAVGALAFGAPAVLALFAAHTFHARKPRAARFYASAAGLLLLIWVICEVRRAFHGGEMAGAPVGLLEGAVYALLALVAAATLAFGARAARATRWGSDLEQAARVLAWAGVLAASVLLLSLRHPWWGAHDGAATGADAAFFAVLAQFAASLIALALGAALPAARGPDPTRFAAAAGAALFAWSGGHGAIRWLFHRGAMDDGAALVGAEGFAHALWPLALAVAGAALAARAQRRATRPYLSDLQAIWAAAIWPALAFACVGLWFLFNPWWGLRAANVDTPFAFALTMTAYLAASWLSMLAAQTPHARRPERLKLAADVAWAGHFLVASALVVRWLRHNGDMRSTTVEGVEIWSILAVWALIGLGVWVARAQRAGSGPAPELFAVTPGARRGKRYGRRQRSP